MGNDKNYREKIEEHRQEVELDDVQLRRTRTRRTQNKKKSTKSPLLSILVFIFILIPLGILAYVWLIYEPEQLADTPIEKPVVQIEKNNEAASSANEDEDEEETEGHQASTETENKEDDQSETQQSSEQNNDDVDVDAQTEAEIAAAAAEAERKLKEQQAKQEAEKQAQAGKKHIVGAGDTLYSISRKYFNGSVSQVNEIIRINNLTSENLTVGQEIILP